MTPGHGPMSLFPPAPRAFLARHRTKANIFYFHFREATSLFSPLRSTERKQVKKTPTGGAWPPSIARRDRKQIKDSGPGAQASPASPLPLHTSLYLPRYLSLPMEGCFALLRVDPQGDIGIQMVQLLGAPQHYPVLPNLQRQPQSSILGILME